MKFCQPALRFMIVFLAAATFGCSTGGPAMSDSGSEQHESEDIPNDFHRPDSLRQAVARMSEIHQWLLENDELPPPTVLSIREVIHGTGDNAHSHFYRIDDDRPTDAHDTDPFEGEDSHDGHETTGEHIHEIRVDALTEYRDLIQWLEEIASDDDLNESEWNQVREISQAMTKQVFPLLQGQESLENLKEYREMQNEIGKFIAELDRLSEK